MVWVETSLHARDVVFQWASTVKKVCPRVGLVQDVSSTYTPNTYKYDLVQDQDQAIKIKQSSLINLVPVAVRLQNWQSDYKPCLLTLSTG